MAKVNKSLHRWLGLGLAVFLLIQGVTGGLLLYGNRLDSALQPELNPAVAGTNRAAFDAVRAAAEAAAPDSQVIFIDRPRPGRSSYRVVLDSALGERLYFHPDTLELLVRRSVWAEPVDIIEAVHTGVIGGEALEILLGLVGLLCLPLLITGLIRWWPRRRWRSALRIQWRNPRVFLFTSHRAIGAVLSLLLLFIVATGVALSFHEWSEKLASGLSGEPPRMHRPQLGDAASPLSVDLSLDALVSAARQRAGGGEPQFVILPHKPAQPVVFRWRFAKEWHPSGRSELYFHPRSGELIDAYLIDERNNTQRVLDSLYPLHIAAPLGAAGKSVWLFAALGLVYFCLSGVAIWWYGWQRKRTSVRRRGVRDEPRDAAVLNVEP